MLDGEQVAKDTSRDEHDAPDKSLSYDSTVIRVAGHELRAYQPPRLRQRELQQETPGAPYAYYPYANETGLREFVPFLEGRTGAIVGVGPDQVLDLFANCEASCAVLVDYTEITSLVSSAQLEVGLFLKHALGRTPTLEEFTHFFDFENLSNVHEVLGRCMDERELAAVMSFFEVGLGIRPGPHEEPISFSYGEYLRARAVLRRQDGEPFAWHASGAGREKVLTAYEQDNVLVIKGDISLSSTAVAVGGVLRARNLSVAAFYLSNLEDYYLARGQPAGGTLPNGFHESVRLAHTLADFPVAENAIILRTNPPDGLSYLRPSEDVRSNRLLHHVTVDFHYNVQAVQDWRAKIGADPVYASGGWKREVRAVLGEDPPMIQDRVTSIGLTDN